MIQIEPFTLDHYRQIVAQPAQAYIGEYVSDADVQILMQHDAFAGVAPGGTVVGAAGAYPVWNNRAICWALLGENAGPYFVQIHRAVQRFLKVQPYRRLECTVAADFHAGHRWARMLGFHLEAERMRAFDAAGKDHALYARIQ
ncbi:hypothetical protein [Pannonibacter tanglangensis]|uniref:N-acetyltransferase domain-containing protein n=1 Tax=Pannonibacter tanglangensis TaxID=2750084 RepID=A0ABW9ZM44_9HYPH|nr:hypothetical protein [Pannonibacter sp. XCT-34]NBN64127.1 hypothetical protein [Pannonibacter sp. XCT-34]